MFTWTTTAATGPIASGSSTDRLKACRAIIYKQTEPSSPQRRITNQATKAKGS